MTHRWLFHATYRPYLAQILAQGLGGAPVPPPRNYEDSEGGVVYLAASAEVALSYAETSEAVPAEWLDDIVVLQVDVPQLEAARVLPDRNVRLDADESPQTFEYRGVVPAAALRLLP